jgi:hypothetical protein
MLYIQPTTNELIHNLLADEYANWSYEGAEALVNYLEDLSDDIGTDIEFDLVAIRCQYREYSSMDELLAEYSSSDKEEVLEHIIAQGENFVIVNQF